MTVTRKGIRRVQDIRTHAGMASEKRLPHQAYLRIACLEMEKFRRSQERQSAMHRVETIDARCGEIGAEQAALLQRVVQQGESRREPCVTKTEPFQESLTVTNGFRIKY